MMMVELLYDLIFADRKTNNRLKLRCDAGFSRFYFSTSNLYYLKCPLYKNFECSKLQEFMQSGSCHLAM